MLDLFHVGDSPAWAYTDEDLTHANRDQRFVECDGPRIVDPRVTQHKELVGWSFEASWEFIDGCNQEIAIEEYLASLSIVF